MQPWKKIWLKHCVYWSTFSTSVLNYINNLEFLLVTNPSSLSVLMQFCFEFTTCCFVCYDLCFFCPVLHYGVLTTLMCSPFTCPTFISLVTSICFYSSKSDPAFLVPVFSGFDPRLVFIFCYDCSNLILPTCHLTPAISHAHNYKSDPHLQMFKKCIDFTY